MKHTIDLPAMFTCRNQGRLHRRLHPRCHQLAHLYLGSCLVLPTSARPLLHAAPTPVLNLVVFTASLGSQLVVFSSTWIPCLVHSSLAGNSLAQHIATSVQASHNFHRPLRLSTDTQEPHESACPPSRGSITPNKVSFAPRVT